MSETVVRTGPTERNYRTGLKQRPTRKEFRCQSLVPNMEAPLIIVKIIVTRTHEHKSLTASLVDYVNCPSQHVCCTNLHDIVRLRKLVKKMRISLKGFRRSSLHLN
jgi:hypothetical protein